MKQPILIVDAYNFFFFRSYCSFPAMDPRTGEHVGGIAGFIKTLSRIVDEIQPSRVFVIWEGGGSSRRRSLYSSYKANRKPGKLNRFYEDDLPDTDENKLTQVKHLVHTLKILPVCQLYVSDVEADDVIAYLVGRHFRDYDKVILSTDKDMYQLLDEKTRVYDLNKKAYVTHETVLKAYNIHPRNFALAKTLCGDGSDNIPGVKGCGFKTVAKRFPFLLQDKDVLLQDVIDFASTRVDEAAVYRNTASSAADLKTYWRLIYLDGSMIPAQSIERLEVIINSYAPELDKLELLKRSVKFGIVNHIDITAVTNSMKFLFFAHEAEEEADTDEKEEEPNE